MPGPLLTEVIADLDEEIIPSKTYKLDYDTKRITGTINGIEAISQYVKKVLSTERASYASYGTTEGIDYGAELNRFIGKPISFIQSDIERTISAALLQDDRILSITDFVVGEPDGDKLTVEFTVNTIYGIVNFNEEANI